MKLGPPLLGPLQLGPHGRFGEARPARAGRHEGIDLVAEEGDPVVAVAPGEIVRAGWDPPPPDGGGGGRYIVQRVLDGRDVWEVGYLHLSRSYASQGSTVEAGELLGAAGSTGTSRSAPHLHFQVKRVVGAGQRVAVDPWPLLLHGLIASVLQVEQAAGGVALLVAALGLLVVSIFAGGKR